MPPNPTRCRPFLTTLCLAATLAACGGSGEPSARAPASTPSSQRAPAPAAALPAVGTSLADQLLDFAQTRFPQYFPQQQATLSLAPFAYRFYPATGAYLGVVVDANRGYPMNGVYVMGGSFGPTPLYVGQLNDFITPVEPLDPMGRVSAGRDYTLALRHDGKVLVWGSGMLGGATEGVAGTAASVVLGLSDIVQVHAAPNDSIDTTHQIALDRNGVVWGWGWNHNGEIGSFPTGRTGVLVDTPRPITELGSAISTAHCGATSEKRLFALRADGTVWFTPGLLANGVVTAKQVPGLAGIVAFGENRESQCSGQTAIGSDGSLWTFTLSNVRTETGVDYSVRATRVANLPPVSQASCSSYHCLALGRDKRVWAWGQNRAGQLGDGTWGGGRTIPFQVPGLPPVRKVLATEGEASFAVTESGALYGWGYTAWSNNLDSYNAPQQLYGAHSGVVDISAAPNGGVHKMLLFADGTVWGWGENFAGQLGDGTQGRAADLPVQALGIDLF